MTAKNLEEWSKMSKTTLWRWLERLEKARRIQSVSDMKLIKIDDNNGRVTFWTKCMTKTARS